MKTETFNEKCGDVEFLNNVNVCVGISVNKTKVIFYLLKSVYGMQRCVYIHYLLINLINDTNVSLE